MSERAVCVCVCEWVEVELSYPLQVLVLNMWQRRRPPRGRSRSFPPCPELHSGQELLCVLPLGSSSILLELPCLGGGPRPGALAHGWAMGQVEHNHTQNINVGLEGRGGGGSLFVHRPGTLGPAAEHSSSKTTSAPPFCGRCCRSNVTSRWPQTPWGKESTSM